MATQAQIEANRRNAQKSTGPRTVQGRITAGQNALRHGLCFQFALVEHETNEEVQALLEALREEHQPVGATEEILVYKMAHHFFAQKRADALIAKQLMVSDSGERNTRELSLLMRYQATADRGFNKCLSELCKLQKQRKIQEIGFVWQEAALSRAGFDSQTESGEPQTEAGEIWNEIAQNFHARQGQSPEIQAQNFR